MKKIDPIEHEKYLLEAEAEVRRNLRVSFMWAKNNLTHAQRLALIAIYHKADSDIIEKCQSFCNGGIRAVRIPD